MDFLASLAASGPVLELGIATGTVALALSERGIEAHGVEASQSMVDELRRKPGGDSLHVVVGDMGEVDLPGPYTVVFAISDTFTMVTNQDAQVEVLRRWGERLAERGVFVIETIVAGADFGASRAGRVSVDHLGPDEVRLTASRYDGLTQRLDHAHLVLRAAGTQILPSQARLVTPPELELMARLAGLRVRERFGGWKREPLAAASVRAVYVLEREGS